MRRHDSPLLSQGIEPICRLIFFFSYKKKGGQIYKGDDIVCDKEYKTNISFFV